MNSFNHSTNTTEPIPTIPYNPPIELTYILDDNPEEVCDPDDCIESCIWCISWLCGRKNDDELKLNYIHKRGLISRKQQEINILKRELNTVEQYSNIILPKELGHKCGDNGGVTVKGYPCRQTRSLDSDGRCNNHKKHKKH